MLDAHICILSFQKKSNESHSASISNSLEIHIKSKGIYAHFTLKLLVRRSVVSLYKMFPEYTTYGCIWNT